MNKLVYVKTHGQVTIPMSLRKIFGIDEGDIMEVKKTKEGILLKPKAVIDKSQAYFWTKEWQKKESESDEDYKKGRYKKFKSVKELIEDLHS